MNALRTTRGIANPYGSAAPQSNQLAWEMQHRRSQAVPDCIDALGVTAPGVNPAFGQEAVLIFCLEVLGRFQPAAPSIVLQILAVEHGLVCGSLASHLSCICLVLGHLPPASHHPSQSVSQQVRVHVHHVIEQSR